MPVGNCKIKTEKKKYVFDFKNATRKITCSVSYISQIPSVNIFFIELKLRNALRKICIKYCN